MAKVFTMDDLGGVLEQVVKGGGDLGMNIPTHLREQAALLRQEQAALMVKMALLVSEVLPGIEFSAPDNTVDVASSGCGFVSSSISMWPKEDGAEVPLLLAGVDPEADWEAPTMPAPIQAAPVQKPKSPSPSM